jgi:putative tryptophan/tyrosine transport system substrate-binding protein
MAPARSQACGDVEQRGAVMNRLRHVLRIAAVACLSATCAAAAHAQAAPKKIAIAGWGPHPSLQEVVTGLLRGLESEGFQRGKDFSVEESNVNFDRAIIPQMLTRLSSLNPDVMVTIATPVSQTAVKTLRDRRFPIVFTPVGDPVAVGLVPSWEKPGDNITGTSNLPDWDAVVGFFATLLPEAKRFGFIYDTGDESSAVDLAALEAALSRRGLSLTKVGMDAPSEAPQRVQSVVGRIDALIMSASGRVQGAAPAIAAVAGRARLPVVGTVPGPVQQHLSLASYSASFDKVGEKAGVMVGKLLKGAALKDLPPGRPTNAELQPIISAEQLAALGVRLPAALEQCNCVVKR